MTVETTSTPSMVDEASEDILVRKKRKEFKKKRGKGLNILDI